MSKSEANIQREIQTELTKKGARLFRVNVGTGWTGDTVRRIAREDLVHVSKGDVVIRKARPLSTGVPKGYPDLSGWTEIEITPDMIGQKLAVFTAIEVKSESGKCKPEQMNFIDNVKEKGGFAGICRSTDDALGVIIKT